MSHYAVLCGTKRGYFIFTDSVPEIVDGTLMMKRTSGEVVYAFAPGRWMEVYKSPGEGWELWRDGKLVDPPVKT